MYFFRQEPLPDNLLRLQVMSVHPYMLYVQIALVEFSEYRCVPTEGRLSLNLALKPKN